MKLELESRVEAPLGPLTACPHSGTVWSPRTERGQRLSASALEAELGSAGKELPERRALSLSSPTPCAKVE